MSALAACTRMQENAMERRKELYTTRKPTIIYENLEKKKPAPTGARKGYPVYDPLTKTTYASALDAASAMGIHRNTVYQKIYDGLLLRVEEDHTSLKGTVE